MNESSKGRNIFRLYLIKPSHYDDDGYVIQWWRSDIPSNTMAVLHGLALDCKERKVLGDNIEIDVEILDETTDRIRPERICEDIASGGGKGLVAFVGVQSNQFPRTLDIARPLRAANVPVCIGGFHVSGSLAMLPEVPAEIKEAWDLGVSIFAGEAEGRFDQVLRDAHQDGLKPLYNYLADLPKLAGAVGPEAAERRERSSLTKRGSFDSGRGCPFECSFCTIVNVHGRKSRSRTADDIESIVRAHYAKGIKKFLVTDDNFARNENWEAIFDRIIHLRQQEGMNLAFMLQVDTLCHKIPNFMEKAGLAGVNRVFIGLETINPDNLIAAKKKQNKLAEYRATLHAWKRIGAITCCGYIIGFPNDTPERLLRDIEIIKRELPVDLIQFACLTPLPGSEDHKVLVEKGAWMDPDLNNYDLEHVTTAHPLMSSEEWFDTYCRAWKAFYTPEHLETIMRRAAASGIKPGKVMKLAFGTYAAQAIEGVHSLQGGIFRRKYRRDRRPGKPLENPLLFYSRYAWECVHKTARLLAMYRTYKRILRRVENDPNKTEYEDLSLIPAIGEEAQTLELFASTEKKRSVN